MNVQQITGLLDSVSIKTGLAPRGHDERFMHRYICERVPEEGERILWADGGDGELWLDLLPVRSDDDGWQLAWGLSEPGCHVSLEDIYWHFRRQEIASFEHKLLWKRFCGIDDSQFKRLPSTNEPRYQFFRWGNGWVVRFPDGGQTLGGYYSGVAYQDMHTLLASPDKPIEYVDLMRVGHYPTPVPTASELGVPVAQFSHQAKVELDGPAKTAIKNRIKKIDEEINRAIEEEGEEADVDEWRKEKQKLASYLKTAGRKFSVDSPAKRKARKAVLLRLHRAWDEIRRDMPALADFLEKHITDDGTAIVYRPPSPSPQWTL